MAKHDIVVLNSTSSGFETDLGSNVARIKGDADNLFSVRNTSGVDKFDISSIENSMIVSSDLTLTGNLSSSLSSTASFGRIDVTNLTGDASQMTNLNQIGHVSSSKQLASRISGAFEHGFELIGENRVISGSATSTGSFTKVFANVYSGDASDMFDVDEVGHFSSSAQLASNISGSFNKGFTHSGTISGSATSTGSFGRITFAGKITGNAAAVTIDESGFFSGSAQLASQISGSFNKGFEYTGLLGTATPTPYNTTSIKLDESDDYMKIIPMFTSGSDGDDKLYGERRFTFSIWVKFNADNDSRNTFIAAGAAAGAQNGLYVWMEDNIIKVQFKVKHGSTMSDTGVFNSGNIALNKWHHLLLSYESNRPNPTASGSFIAALDGIQNFGKVMQSGSYIDYQAPTVGDSVIGTYSAAGENPNMTIADITMWKHSIQSASTDASISSGSLMTTLFNHGIVPDYTASFSTDYPDAYREKLKFAFNFNSASYAGSSYSMYDRTGNTGFTLTSTDVDQGKIVSGSGDYPTEGVFYTTGSFGRIDVNSISGDASQVTGLEQALPAGVISSSAQIASNISGSFTSGFLVNGTVSGSATSTGSFGKYEFGSSISISDFSDLIGIPSSEGFFSSSAQLSSQISGAFTEGFEFNGHISGSNATSTGSFSKVIANTYNANASNVTGFTLPSGLASGSAGFASQISGSFKGGFTMLEGGVISSSVKFISSSISSSNSEIGMGIGNDGSTSQSIDSASFSVGLANFANLKINDGVVTSISHRTAILSQNILTKNEQNISGSLRGLPRFRQDALISGSATSTGSYARLRAESITAKDIVGDVRKPISGSMGHDTYISASFRSVGTDKPIKIPVRGKIFNSINTKQFTATGSMKDQKYRTQPGQLFVDNWGRLNMTVQTGSMIAQASAWSTPYPSGLSGRFGGIASKSTTAGAGGQQNTWKQYDGISVKDIPSGGGNNYGWTTGIQIAGDGIDDMITFSNGFPADYDTMVWNGVTWYKVQKTPINVYSSVVLTQGTQNDSGFIGGQYSGTHGCTLMNWNGTSFHNTAQALNSGRYYGNGSGTTNAGLVTGGAESASPYPSSTCTEEWNGSTWATAGALGRAQHGGSAGGTQNATTYYGGYPNAYTEEYNGTAWSTGPNGPNATTQAGGSGGAGNMMQSSGLGGAAGIHIYETAYVTGSADTYNDFSQNTSGRYLLTKKLQANLSPSAGGTATTGSSSGYGGGY